MDQRPGSALGRKAVENPRPFREALDQSGPGQKFQMSRQARLALVQNLGQFAHGQFAMGEERKNPGPRHLAGGA